jgi:hypothetical protein
LVTEDEIFTSIASITAKSQYQKNEIYVKRVGQLLKKHRHVSPYFLLNSWNMTLLKMS